MNTLKATIKTGDELTSRSICDHDCIFRLKVIERKGNWATIERKGYRTQKVKIRTNYRYSICGDSEYLKPDNYSMAPIFWANKPAVEPVEYINFAELLTA